MLSSTKKAKKKPSEVRIDRSQEDWVRLINDARRKESNWKYLREDEAEELSERDEVA